MSTMWAIGASCKDSLSDIHRMTGASGQY